MSAWCEYQSLEGCAAFLQLHAAEEMGHMQRLFTYVNETCGLAILGQIDAPPSDYESIVEVFKHKVLITKQINELAKIARDEGDFSTFNFLQWYVAEQHEEEKTLKSITDKIDMIGLEGSGLFFIDKEIEKISAETHSSQADNA